MSFRRVLTALFTVLLVCSTVFGVQNQYPRGITARIQEQRLECVAVDLAAMRLASASSISLYPTRQSTEGGWRTMGIDDWVPIDTIRNTVRIPPGDRYVLVLNSRNGSISEISPEIELDDYVMEAVERSPRWLRADLATNLSAIQGDFADIFQEWLAEIILEAEDPYVDEIAFTAAHVSPGLLGSGELYFELFVENVLGIYEADEYLDYVSIIDYGEAGDDDYWSTLEFNIGTEDDTVQVEIDPFYYYWYVVHPRISDEHPLYINPASGRPQGPPRGVFWRDFLLNHPDDEYPSLREAIEDCGVMWSNLINNGTPENGAVGAVSEWINTVLEFDSRNERPIQPVRIYNLHMGRCGEHQDMTVAAGRSALIPTTGVSCWPFDHVWNQFYDGRWMQWEPEGNSAGDSLRYDVEGNRQIPALFAWRGDGFVETVTPRFSEDTADLVVEVSDRNNKPVDGVKVMLASEAHGGGLTIATWGFTNSEGRATIKIGNLRNFYIRIDSEIGSYPEQENQVTQIITNSQADRVYEWSRRLNGEVPELDIHEADPVEDPVNHFHLSVNYEPLVETVSGQLFSQSEFLAGIYSARFDFFICDQANYNQYLDSESFEAFNITELTEEGELEFTLPTDDEWYAVVSNEQQLVNLEDIRLEAYWYQDSEWSVPGLATQPGMPGDYALSQNFPNPFNSTTTIRYILPFPSLVSVQVYNLSGQQIATLFEGQQQPGFHSANLTAGNLPSGLYFVRLNHTPLIKGELKGNYQTRKVLLIK